MKKTIKIILIIIASIVLLGTIFGTVDYIRAINGKKPIFIYRNGNIYKESNLTITEYYGLGYKIIICKENCDKPITIMPLYLGTYAWFIGADYITNVEVVKTKKCDNKAKLYYTVDNRNIYTYCLDQIKISKSNEIIQLKDYLEVDPNAIDFVINDFTEEPEGLFDDGGSLLYSGIDFNLLECHTLAGNNDIYIGTENMEYFNDFCK